ncbi:hypothetical protein [Limosilactobacillus vaginalis]|uniref:hypothetical protein n=1 Tax=Limosilactobacillus vaginalis TaxID=1633 RepID=UPI003F1F5F5E
MKTLRKNIWIITATIIFIAILIIEAVKRLDWKSFLVLFAFFLVWCIIVFANIATFFDNREFSFLGFKISSKQSKLSDEEKIVNQLASLEDKCKKQQKQLDEINSHFNSIEKESTKIKQQANLLFKQITIIKNNEQKNLKYSFESLNVSSKSNRLSLIGTDYESPELLSKFVELKQKAIENKYRLNDDRNYTDLLVHLTNEVLSNLSMSTKIRMQENHTIDSLSIDLEEKIRQVFNDKEVNFATLQTIENQIEKADSDPNIPISFSKAKSDLKKLQA